MAGQHYSEQQASILFTQARGPGGRHMRCMRQAHALHAEYHALHAGVAGARLLCSSCAGKAAVRPSQIQRSSVSCPAGT